MKKTGAVLTLAAFLGACLQVQAMPARPSLLDGSSVIQVYNGCGVYGHRGPWGGCRAGGQWGGYNRGSCPPGFHVGRYGHFCFRN